MRDLDIGAESKKRTVEREQRKQEMNQDEKYMKEAIRQAKKGDMR